MFVVLCPFCEVNSGGISLTSFEVGFGSVSTLPLGINGKRAGGGTVTEHNLRLTPIDMRVMFPEPSIAEDNVVVSRVVHGFGQTCGFCRTGPAGTGPVSDLLTRANTVPVTGYLWVSATGSHA